MGGEGANGEHAPQLERSGERRTPRQPRASAGPLTEMPTSTSSNTVAFPPARISAQSTRPAARPVTAAMAASIHTPPKKMTAHMDAWKG